MVLTHCDCSSELGELGGWREGLEMIVEANSARIQRQVGDFHGLREKVMRLHSEFERVRRASLGAAPPASPVTPATPVQDGKRGPSNFRLGVWAESSGVK